MERDVVKAALLKVLTTIQVASGLPCPQLKDTIRPVDDLPKFDSKIWPVAFGLIGRELGVEAPVDVNVFREEQTKVPYDIEQTVTAIIKALTKKVKKLEVGVPA